MNTLKQIIISFIDVTIILLYGGYVGMLTWNWFVPLVFHKAPHISIGTAIGLLVVSLAFAPYTPNLNKDKTTTELFIYSMCHITTVFLISFFVHIFVF